MRSPRESALAMQLASVAAGAASMILAKLALQTLPIALFLLLFAAASVLLSIRWADRASMRSFLSGRAGWLAVATNLAALWAFYAGLAALDPGTHSFLSRSYVAFSFVFSHLLFREPFGPVRLGLALLCVLSALLAAAPAEMAAAHWWPVAATVLSAALFALNFALLRMVAPSVSAAAPITAYNAALLPLALAALLVPGAPVLPAVPWEGLAYGAGSAALATLSLYWYVRSARGVSFFASTVVRASSPFIVAALALPFFPMALTPANALGVLLLPCVLAAMAVLELRGARTHPPD
jgi:drug/metabolite transporter (DMT)-like permease